MEFAFVSQAIETRIEAVMTEYGLTAQQFNLLRILRGTYPRTQCMQEIKAKLIDRNSDATRLVARMVSKDLVIQKDSLLDKRKKEISISEQGLELLKKVDQNYPGFPYSLIEFLEEAEIQVLVEKLTQIRESLE